MTTRTFPDGFLWGAATAGHQVEGNNVNSDLWLLENVEGSFFAEPSGIACDHYARYREDIAMMADVGLRTFRTSVEWARIEPEEGVFDAEAIAHYRDVFETCHRYGIAPVVTYNHFASPRWLLAQGGWEGARTPELFARYCTKVTEGLGDLYEIACTLNEPNLPFLLNSFGIGISDPESRRHIPMLVNAAAALGVDPVTVAPFQFSATEEAFATMVAAHRLGKAAIKAVRPSMSVGWALANSDIQAAPGGEEEVAASFRQLVNGRFLEISRDDDFVGIQTYGRHVFDAEGSLVPAAAGTPVNQAGDEIYPQGLGSTVREAWEVAGVPVYVTENGLNTTDDAERIQFLEDSIEVVADCLADGVDVRGYIVWTLMDNFEWVSAYTPKFGLVAVDRETLARTPRPSATWFGNRARSNGAKASS